MSNNETAVTSTVNFVPVQGTFQPAPGFELISLIGPAGTPFYASISPNQSGLSITNSTINSTTIGAISPSTAAFTAGTVTAAPSSATDIANKQYVDYFAAGLSWKAPVIVATTVNITSLSGLLTVDTITLVAGDTVLVKNQTNAADNGIYVVAAGAWTRSIGCDVWSEFIGAIVFVVEGSQNGSAWYCTAQPGGTLGVTPNNWPNFAVSSTYTAGTGLTLVAQQFSITPVGTAGTYGSASSVPVFVTNASGQVSSVTNTAIAIANTAVSGLGTMSTQNANAVAITGGTINGATVGASTAAAITGTTVTANTQFTGAGTGLSGTASGLSIGGNAATATSATSATTATNIAGGATGSLPYQTAASTTGMLAAGTNGQVLTLSAGSPSWATPTTGTVTSVAISVPAFLSVTGSPITSSGTLAVSYSGTALPLANGGSGQTTAQLAMNAFAGAVTSGSYLRGNGTNVIMSTIQAADVPTLNQNTTGTASNVTGVVAIANGGTNSSTATPTAGAVPYGTGTAYAFTAAGTSGQVLTSAGSSTPTWTTPVSYATVTDDTTTATTRYPLFASATAGNLTTEYVSSTKLQYVPLTGVLTAVGFSGSGASLTSLTAGNLSGTIPSAVLGNSTVYVGTTAIALNRASGSISLTGTNIDGSAGSATTATTATNATNIAITDNTSSASTYYPVISSATSGNVGATTSSTKLSFVPNTGTLTATNFAGLASNATNIAGGANLQIPYNTASSTTSFITAPTTATTYLQYNGTGFVWSSVTATTATNLAGGVVGSIPYQSALNTTLFLAGNATTTPQFVTSTGTLGLPTAPTLTGSTGSGSVVLATSPTLVTPALGTPSALVGTNITGTAASLSIGGTAANATNVAVTDNTSSAAVWYPTFTSTTTGNLPITVSSTKLKYTPSTGALTVSQLIIAP
jgi:hypothetical protein